MEGDSRSLKILNLNVWLLPPPLAHHNTKRIEKLVAYIRERGPDVVTLQEVWLSRYTRALAKALPEYTTLSSSDPKRGVWNWGGLVTLT